MYKQPTTLHKGTSGAENESTRTQHEVPESCVTGDCFIMCGTFVSVVTIHTSELM